MSTFNTLRCARRLKEAGMPESLANAQAEILGDAFENMASKDDLKHLETNLNQKVDAIESKLDAKINTVEIVLSSKIAAVDTKLNWLMTLMGFIGLVLAAINFFHNTCH